MDKRIKIFLVLFVLMALFVIQVSAEDMVCYPKQEAIMLLKELETCDDIKSAKEEYFKIDTKNEELLGLCEKRIEICEARVKTLETHIGERKELNEQSIEAIKEIRKGKSLFEKISGAIGYFGFGVLVTVLLFL